ncbi:MAG: nucleoside recognition protein [Verrucomicrobia bacterium]|nr:MAG: nucleoside recognition protein [Verrucomicrobiota bacterium]
MLNYIWFGLIFCAVVLGAIHNRLTEVTLAAFDSAKAAVMNIALPLIGIFALWLGIMRLAEKAGIVQIIARGLQPLLKFLFPEIPKGHPALGSIVMNMAANMLGLANAATPVGLKAMQELERLNPHPGIATNAMCTFLALNTSSVQLIPTTTIAILAAAGSKEPTAIIGTTLVATACSTIAAIASVKLLQRAPIFRLPQSSEKTLCAEVSDLPEVALISLPLWAKAILVALSFFFIFIAWHLVVTTSAPSDRGIFSRLVDVASQLAIPVLLTFFPLYAALKRIPVYEEFIEGAKEGFHTGIRIIPYLVAILVAIGMFRAAGGIELLSHWLRPIFQPLHFPPDLLPLALIRPLSGSGANGIFAELVQSHNPDSLVARIGGTFVGSSETTFYVLAVYFGAVSIRRTRQAVPAGLIADLTGLIVSVIICNFVFGGKS